MIPPRPPFIPLRILIASAVLLGALVARAQDGTEEVEEDAKERVQYQLVLPDEKTPETVKPEEHNPFESETEAASRNSPGDTEENRVRDILMKLPVNGMSRKPDGRLRVLLGDIDLTVGDYVPQVLPDQLVALKVKSITSEYIELAWQEKQMVGLPPKIMLIPIDMAPSVTYRMKGGQGADAPMTRIRRGGSGMMRNGQPVIAAPAGNPAASFSTSAPAVPAAVPSMAATERSAPPSSVASPSVQPAVPSTPAAPAATSPNPAIESAVRMLFGNPTPAPQ
ncbi:MAG: hypothetical protein HS117_12945 [Verrucomicrobiaceae bacterium]|jgi:hypothetical protein|nr:hypothetical protein [Verrucomicrobiaceae bacterium]